jgi:endonuclease YncB( thermonuclease family)
MLLALALLVSLEVGAATKAPPAKEWERFDGCILIPDRWNDGDSFHVRLPDGREKIFRLYFVDAPESDARLANRTVEQASYFGITQEQVVEVGKRASTEVAERLGARPFSVWTRWHDAGGRSTLGRSYAVVAISGNDLAEWLVSNGLARIYGSRTPLPDGRTSQDYRLQLGRLEAGAKSRRTGAWRIVKPMKQMEAEPAHAAPLGAPPPTISCSQPRILSRKPRTSVAFSGSSFEANSPSGT